MLNCSFFGTDATQVLCSWRRKRKTHQHVESCRWIEARALCFPKISSNGSQGIEVNWLWDVNKTWGWLARVLSLNAIKSSSCCYATELHTGQDKKKKAQLQKEASTCPGIDQEPSHSPGTKQNPCIFLYSWQRANLKQLKSAYWFLLSNRCTRSEV